MNETLRHTRETRQNIEAQSELLVSEIQHTVLDTAKRITTNIDPNNLPSFLKFYPIRDVHEPTIFLTDRPKAIFGGNETLYTITSTLALENVRDGNLLTPAKTHSFFGPNIQTHRGIGLALFSTLMTKLGFSLNAKDQFVWLGPKIDGEQFVLEDNIAHHSELVDTNIASIFFDHTDLKKYDHNLNLNPRLHRLLTSIGDGQILYDRDHEITHYVDELLDTLHRYTGVREGWFNALEGICKGTISPNRVINPDDIDWHLTLIATTFAQSVPRASQAIIVEVDTSKLMSSTPIFPFPLTHKHPDAIIPSPHLPLDAVKTVYAETPLDLPGGFDIQVKTIEELPEDAWLKDGNNTTVSPTVARKNGVNPRSPVCAVRYSRSPFDVWAEHIENGDMAPLYGIPHVDLISPNSHTEHVL